MLLYTVLTHEIGLRYTCDCVQNQQGLFWLRKEINKELLNSLSRLTLRNCPDSVSYMRHRAP